VIINYGTNFGLNAFIFPTPTSGVTISHRVVIRNRLFGSVADPDPSDPYVFGPPGSGSISQMYGSESGSFYHQAKIVIKPLIPTV
jgi:hypothetical protein